MTFFNYSYNLNNGQTYSYQQKGSGSAGSFGSSGTLGGASSTGTVVVGNVDGGGSIGSVGQLSLSVIISQFESGNLTFEEFIKGLIAKGAKEIISGYTQYAGKKNGFGSAGSAGSAGSTGSASSVSLMFDGVYGREVDSSRATGTNSNKYQVTFEIKGKKYTCSVTRSAAASQVDDNTVTVYSAATLQKTFSNSVIRKYFTAVETKDGVDTKYEFKPVGDIKTVSQLKTFLKQEKANYQNSLILQNFMNNVNRTSDNVSDLNNTSDGVALTLQNYEQIAKKMKLVSGDELDALKKEALNKFVSDFQSGNLAYANVDTVLKAIGVKSLKKTTANDCYEISFKFDNKKYKVTCNKDAAKSGTDNINVNIYEQYYILQNVINGVHTQSDNLDDLKASTGNVNASQLNNMDGLKEQALDKFIEDFENGMAGISSVRIILGAIGANDVNIDIDYDKNIFTVDFVYAGSDYHIECNVDAAELGADDNVVRKEEWQNNEYSEYDIHQLLKQFGRALHSESDIVDEFFEQDKIGVTTYYTLREGKDIETFIDRMTPYRYESGNQTALTKEYIEANGLNQEPYLSLIFEPTESGNVYLAKDGYKLSTLEYVVEHKLTTEAGLISAKIADLALGGHSNASSREMYDLIKKFESLIPNEEDKAACIEYERAKNEIKAYAQISAGFNCTESIEAIFVVDVNWGDGYSIENDESFANKIQLSYIYSMLDNISNILLNKEDLHLTTQQVKDLEAFAENVYNSDWPNDAWKKFCKTETGKVLFESAKLINNTYSHLDVSKVQDALGFYPADWNKDNIRPDIASDGVATLLAYANASDGNPDAAVWYARYKSLSDEILTQLQKGNMPNEDIYKLMLSGEYAVILSSIDSTDVNDLVKQIKEGVPLSIIAGLYSNPNNSVTTVYETVVKQLSEKYGDDYGQDDVFTEMDNILTKLDKHVEVGTVKINSKDEYVVFIDSSKLEGISVDLIINRLYSEPQFAQQFKGKEEVLEMFINHILESGIDIALKYDSVEQILKELEDAIIEDYTKVIPEEYTEADFTLLFEANYHIDVDNVQLRNLEAFVAVNAPDIELSNFDDSVLLDVMQSVEEELALKGTHTEYELYTSTIAALDLIQKAEKMQKSSDTIDEYFENNTIFKLEDVLALTKEISEVPEEQILLALGLMLTYLDKLGYDEDSKNQIMSRFTNGEEIEIVNQESNTNYAHRGPRRVQQNSEPTFEENRENKGLLYALAAAVSSPQGQIVCSEISSWAPAACATVGGVVGGAAGSAAGGVGAVPGAIGGAKLGFTVGKYISYGITAISVASAAYVNYYNAYNGEQSYLKATCRTAVSVGSAVVTNKLKFFKKGYGKTFLNSGVDLLITTAGVKADEAIASYEAPGTKRTTYPPSNVGSCFTHIQRIEPGVISGGSGSDGKFNAIDVANAIYNALMLYSSTGSKIYAYKTSFNYSMILERMQAVENTIRYYQSEIAAAKEEDKQAAIDAYNQYLKSTFPIKYTETVCHITDDIWNEAMIDAGGDAGIAMSNVLLDPSNYVTITFLVSASGEVSVAKS